MRGLSYPRLLPLEIPAERVVYARHLDVNELPKRVASLLSRVRSSRSGGDDGARIARPAEAATPTAPPGPFRRLLRHAGSLYGQATNWPDPQIGWLPFALRDGARLLRTWRADLIYASVPPLTGALVASRLARRFRVPWIAEFRDLWVDHPYYDAPAWRRRLERLQERRTLQSAAGLVTVSDAWADVLRQRFDKPTATILNGFDPDDFPAEPPPPGDPRQLTILYTGTLYPGRRDPGPVFAAAARLGEIGRRIRFLFYGADPSTVQAMAREAGVEDRVDARPPVAYAEAVALQRAADILLLLRWNDPTERGVVPGKLFEYLAARRPIICLGYPEGAVPEVIHERRAGLVSEDPERIAAELRRWITEKEETGIVAPLPLDARRGLSRPEQFAILMRFMERSLNTSAGSLAHSPANLSAGR
jgi:glycosyltransferase involved in cell wall biosynthesis